MGQLSLWERVADWLAYLPMRFAYRIVWASARMNLGSARDVYRAMWDANLSLPPMHSPGDTP